jgi:hypothetical protein
VITEQVRVVKMKLKSGWDPYQMFTWTMVAFGITVTLWEFWDCTQWFLAKPISIEEEFVSISDLPPIQLSICRIFTIAQLLKTTGTES